MKREDLESIRDSTAVTLTVSLIFLLFRILDFHVFENAFEVLCIHVPALSALILYISIRIGLLKVVE